MQGFWLSKKLLVVETFLMTTNPRSMQRFKIRFMHMLFYNATWTTSLKTEPSNLLMNSRVASFKIGDGRQDYTQQLKRKSVSHLKSRVAFSARSHCRISWRSTPSYAG